MVDLARMVTVMARAVSLSCVMPKGEVQLNLVLRPVILGAAFLEFHEPLAAFLHPETVGPSHNDTLLASGEVYNNWVRMDVWYRNESVTASA